MMKFDFQEETSMLRYTIRGKINLPELQKLRRIQANIASGKKIRILAIVDSFDGYGSFGAAKEALLLDLGWIQKADRYALVGDQDLLRKGVQVLGALVPKITFRTFTRAEERKAEDWLLDA